MNSPNHLSEAIGGHFIENSNPAPVSNTLLFTYQTSKAFTRKQKLNWHATPSISKTASIQYILPNAVAKWKSQKRLIYQWFITDVPLGMEISVSSPSRKIKIFHWWKRWIKSQLISNVAWSHPDSIAVGNFYFKPKMLTSYWEENSGGHRSHKYPSPGGQWITDGRPSNISVGTKMVPDRLLLRDRESASMADMVNNLFK